MENTYDQQTDHGLKEKMQRKWAEYAAELLARDYPWKLLCKLNLFLKRDMIGGLIEINQVPIQLKNNTT